MIKKLLVLVLGIFFSCKSDVQKNVIIVKEYPKKINIMADTIAVEPALLEVVEMAVIDEFLVALDTKGDNYFHFFDLKSLEFLFFLLKIILLQ